MFRYKVLRFELESFEFDLVDINLVCESFDDFHSDKDDLVELGQNFP